MDIYSVDLPANQEVALPVFSVSALALKIRADKKNAVIFVRIGERPSEALGCDSWLDTRNLYVMPNQVVVVSSNIPTKIGYHFQEIDINEIVVATPEPTFTWNSTDETSWNSTNETLWNGG